MENSIDLKNFLPKTIVCGEKGNEYPENGLRRVLEIESSYRKV